MAGKKTRSQKSTNLLQVTNVTNHSSKSQSQNQTSKELKSMTKKKLKSELRQRGRKTSGNKLKLIERLGNKMSSSVKRKDVNEVPATTNGSSKQMETKESSESEKLIRQRDNEDRKNLVLWKRPFSTLEYSIRECSILLITYGRRLLQNKKLLVPLMVLVLFISILMNTSGPHQSLVQATNKKIFWCFYWIGLGVLSSVGLGTGLHTFLLYLGPHIARVTLAAYECNSVDFPEPPYPDDIICPADDVTSTISIFDIMSKVRLEAMCWGAGTALGELPPYFMARAARLSGIDPDDEDDDLKEFEELQRKAEENQELTVIQKGKLFVENLVKKVGFFGILACASIPNPLFDLAGITCGHFLVPFWTFFGATLIGKAVIKMHIQKLFVIIAFDEKLIHMVLGWLKIVPVVGEKLQVPFKAFLDGQKTKLHKKDGASNIPDSKNFLGTFFEVFVMAMVLYFVVSIVNSLAQNYHKRISKKRSDKVSKD